MEFSEEDLCGVGGGEFPNLSINLVAGDGVANLRRDLPDAVLGRVIVCSGDERPASVISVISDRGSVLAFQSISQKQAMISWI